MTSVVTSKRSWFRDRSALVRLGAVGAVRWPSRVAGCGTMMPGGNTGAAGPRRTRPRPGPGPGVTDDSVKVVFVAVDLDAVKKVTGFNTASVGDQEAQVQALEDWVNANGGIAGRKLDAVFRLYDAQADSPAAEEQLCNQITQDDQAFAVVMTGQYQTNARPCYAERQTLVLDASLYAMSTRLLRASTRRTSGRRASPSTTRSCAPTSRCSTSRASSRARTASASSPPTRRSTARRSRTSPSRCSRTHGVEPEVAWVDTTDTGTLFEGLDAGARSPSAARASTG